MIRVMLSATLVVMLLTRIGYAFDVGAFKSGMHVKDALSVAKKKDPEAYINKSEDKNFYYSTVIIEEVVDNSKKINWSLGFCSNKLVSLHKSYPLNWLEAANIVRNLNAIYSNGYVVEDVDRLKGNSSVGTIDAVGIQIQWSNNSESVIVSISQVNDRDYITEYYMLNDNYESCFGSKAG